MLTRSGSTPGSGWMRNVSDRLASGPADPLDHRRFWLVYIVFMAIILVILPIVQRRALASSKISDFRSYESATRWAGLPVFAVGAAPVAVVAIGGRPRGVVAIGGIAVGLVAVGGLAAGGLAIGGVSLGGLGISWLGDRMEGRRRSCNRLQGLRRPSSGWVCLRGQWHSLRLSRS